MSDQGNGRKRLLLCCDSPTAPTGLARITRQLLKRYEDEYEVAVMAWGYDNRNHEYPCHLYPIRKRDPHAGSHFIGMAGDWRPDVVLCVGDPWDFLHVPNAVTVVRQQTGKRFSWYYLALIDGYPMRKEWLPVFSDPDGVAVTSAFGRKAIRELNPALDPPVIRLAVDSDFWKVAAEHKLIIGDGAGAKEVTRDNTFVIFWAGVNSNRKNLDALLRAAAPVLKAHEDAYLLLHVAYDDITGVDVFDIGQQIGLPPAQYAVNKGPANRRGIEDGRLRQYYAISTVCACSSIGEGNWLPGYEAQACGCVPIGPRFSAIPETIGSRGILVPTAYEGYVGEFGYVRAWVNVEKFTEELEGLYDDWKSNDSQRIRDMRARGRQWAERHTWDKFADAVTKLITTPKDRSKDPSRARTWVKEKVSMTSETLAMCCPTFTQNCGIAHYSESLVDALHDNGIHMKTFATKEPQRLAEGAIEQGFSLVHLQHEYSFYEKAKLQFFYRALADAGIASVTTMHTTMRDEAVSRPVLEGSSVVLVHSAVQKQMLLDMVPEAENVRIMPMGAPFMQLRSRKRLRLSLGYHEDDFVLGSYGFLRDQKGFDVLLNTVVRMEASVRLFIFSSPHLFGSPDYDERFMRTIEEMGLTDRVLLLREQLKTKSEVCNLLSVADVLVLAYRDPPDYCGVSSAAKDCAAAGRPLVLTDSSAFSDFKENEAIRVPQNDHEPVIAAVKMLRGDAELREKLAHAARQHAWEHRWDHVGKLHAELYQSVLEGSE